MTFDNFSLAMQLAMQTVAIRDSRLTNEPTLCSGSVEAKRVSAMGTGFAAYAKSSGHASELWSGNAQSMVASLRAAPNQVPSSDPKNYLHVQGDPEDC